MNYYNENDPSAAAWLRALVAEGLIPVGHVDERSIADVSPSDLSGFRQCHFFAGIGGWSLALQLAGWPSDRPVWTGSCPCQPFSVAGKGLGERDERHLWPVWLDLIRQCRPPVVFGEQVEGAVRHGWLDGVFADLEGEGYACGAAVLGAHSVGSPHIRQRLFWVADSGREFDERRGEPGIVPSAAIQAQGAGDQWQRGRDASGDCRATRRLADPADIRGPQQLDEPGGRARREAAQQDSAERARSRGLAHLPGERRDGPAGASGEDRRTLPEFGGPASGMGDPDLPGRREQCGTVSIPTKQPPAELRGDSRPWDNFDILPCTDGKARRIEPVPQRMVDGLPADLDGRWKDRITEIQERIERHAEKTNATTGQTLRAMLEAVQPHFLQWRSGGCDALQGAALLFVALRQLQGQLGVVFSGTTQGIAEAQEEQLREMRENGDASRPSQGRKLPQQQAIELGDLVSTLSQGRPFDDEIVKFVTHGFPLHEDFPGRRALLRGFGNAIVPQLAAEFVAAYLAPEP